MFVMRIAYLLALGLTLAGLVHIGSLLGVPRLAVAGPYDRLAALNADGRFVVIDDNGAGAELLPFRDPAFVTAACRYDLKDGPVTVRAPLGSTYGALSVHSRFGQPFYALTDKAATDGVVEVTILAADDVPEAELDDPEEGKPALRIVSPTDQGFLMVRLFSSGESARAGLRSAAAGASCARASPRKVRS